MDGDAGSEPEGHEWHAVRSGEELESAGSAISRIFKVDIFNIARNTCSKRVFGAHLDDENLP